MTASFRKLLLPEEGARVKKLPDGRLMVFKVTVSELRPLRVRQILGSRVYETSDGELFTSAITAARHELSLESTNVG